MRFMLLMIPSDYANAEPGTLPTPELAEKMTKYNDSLNKAGVLLALDGLHPPSLGVRVAFSGGKPSVTEGPFSGVGEVLAGYWLIQVKSREEAVEWARRCPARDGDVIELRQVLETSDFSPEVQAAVL